MESVNKNQSRIGNPTSSEIVALTKSGKGEMFGAAAKTYIEECNMERRLGRSISEETNSKPTSWGQLVEKRVFELLGLEYRLCSQETIGHPHFDYWFGSPDGEKFDEGKTVIDIKSPKTLKSFCQIVDCKTIEQVRENHKDGEKYYWQLVSNAILTGAENAELIVYVPYQSELEDIRELARNADEGVMSKYYWIHNATDEELPYLIEGGHYKNLNILRFKVPQADKDFLTERVAAAGKLLEPFKSIAV